MQEFDPNLLSDMLPVYYNRLFPLKVFCRWLACGCSPQPLANREISFTLADDVYLRYLSFSNQKELQAMLQKKCPNKIDVGAVYNTKPSIARHGAVVVARELVFDIDLTDYDDVRTCCQDAKMQEFDPNLLSDMLPVYYNRLFPLKVFCRWLACGCSPQPLANREISFTLADDVYLRYLSFSNQKELQAMLQKKCPNKIDVGAVYNTKPSIARHGAVVVARELVFDIDLTDYDDVRTCCQDAKVCSKCWKFMTVASQILDVALRDDFGFSNILWVFSGRRGVHCWVSDYDARTLDGPGRSAVADYLCLVTGGENQPKKVNLNSDSLHSSIRRAHRIIVEHFDEILQDQNFLSTPEGLKKLMSMIPDESLAGQVEKQLIKLPGESRMRWDAFVQLYGAYWKESGTRKLKNLIEEIQIQWCYPRLDVNVTKGSNHLLKSPFSVHPKTGNVCVIFRPSNAKDMNLDEVPRLQVLLEESSPDNAVQQKNMQAAIKLFQEHVFALEKEEAKRKRLADTSIDF